MVERVRERSVVIMRCALGAIALIGTIASSQAMAQKTVITPGEIETATDQLRRPHPSRPAVSEEVAATESRAALPGGTFSHQVTDRVTVTAVDRDAGSITVKSRDGRTVSRRVQNPSDLDGVTRGDDIDITYTEALLATVARAK